MGIFIKQSQPLIFRVKGTMMERPNDGF